MELVVSLLSWACLVSGSFFAITAGIGMLRLPDFFTRTHAAGILDTLGVALIMAGLALQAGYTLVTVKLILIVLFILITGPAAVHALARSAVHADVKPLLGSKLTENSDHADR